MTLESRKYLGGIGALLLFLIIVPSVGWILALIGLILSLIGFKGLADYYKEQGIFNNALYTVIMGIIGVGVFIALLLTAAIGFLTELGIDFANIADSAAWFAQISDAEILNVAMGYITQFAVAVLALWVCIIIGAILLRRSLGVVSEKSGVGLFGTTGLIFLIGAIIPVIGLFLIWISFLLLAIAFFMLKPQQQT
jgi:uncharacterized membrane protein